MGNRLLTKKVDISYIDPNTGEVVCTFNQCREKFTVEGFEIVKNEYNEEKHFFFHACIECGRREQTRADKYKGPEMDQKKLIEKLEGKK